MSLIIDALKKSEKSRHGEMRSVIPMIVSPRRGRYKAESTGRKKRRISVLFLILIQLVLAVVAIGLVIKWLNQSENDLKTPKDKVSLNKLQQTAIVGSYPQDQPVAQSVVEQQKKLSALKPQSPVTAKPKDTPKIKPSDKTKIRRLSDMPTEFHNNVAPLHLDFHLYSSDQKRRVVFINGVEYKEGVEIRDGLFVRRILEQGALLDFRGTRFLLTIND